MDGPIKLPPRQQQVLAHLRRGYSEKQIALALSLSQHTIHVYIKSLYRHFGASSLGELLSRWASRDDCPACGKTVELQGSVASRAPAPLASGLENVCGLLHILLIDAESERANLACRAEIAQALASTYAAMFQTRKVEVVSSNDTDPVESRMVDTQDKIEMANDQQAHHHASPAISSKRTFRSK